MITLTTHCYVTSSDVSPIISVHRRAAHAKAEIKQLADGLRAEGFALKPTTDGVCIRAQRGNQVHYFQVIKKELK